MASDLGYFNLLVKIFFIIKKRSSLLLLLASKSICLIVLLLIFFTLYIVVQFLSCVWLFETPWTATHKASLFFTISWSLLKLMSIVSMMPSNHLILCCPFSSCLQSLPASGSFPMSHFFSTGSQSIGASSTPTILMFWISSWITWWLPLGATSRKGLISKGVLLLHGEIGIKG